MSIFVTIKYSLVRQLRSKKFWLIMAVCVLVGFFCVPSAKDHYEIFYTSGVRGIYNSAWLGGLAPILTSILFWLPGFYIMRNRISEDGRLKIGEIIAATPISKFKYIVINFISNFSVLMAMELFFLVTFIIMQLFRGESFHISFLQYVLPLIILTVPSFLVLAALTVLFDVIPFLKGSMGNILIFVVWIALLMLSVAIPNNNYDLFGINFVLEGMGKAAVIAFPGLNFEGGSLGYYALSQSRPTFVFEGLTWNTTLLTFRMIWVLVALAIIIVATLWFDRFRKERKSKKNVITFDLKNPKSVCPKYGVITLSKVKNGRGVRLFYMIRKEIKIMLTRMSKWWFLATIVGIGLSSLVNIKSDFRMAGLLMLLPFPILGKMGCLDKEYNTEAFLQSSCSNMVKWLATLVAGILINFVICSGILVRFYLLGEIEHLIAWSIGCIFIAVLAITLGSISGNSKLFEGIYIAWMYFGPFNNIWKLDFLGISSSNNAFYGSLIVVILAIGIVYQIGKEKNII